MINYSIDFCHDFKQIINVWEKVFGDSEEDILYFLNNCKNKKCIGAFIEGKLAAMLFLVDCKSGSLNGKYIYAVATLPEYRNNGLAAAIIYEAEKYKNDFLWLIPANESLIAYYEKFGFKIRLYLNAEERSGICFDEESGIVDYLYEGCEMTEPIGMVLSDNEFPAGNIRVNLKENN